MLPNQHKLSTTFPFNQEEQWEENSQVEEGVVILKNKAFLKKNIHLVLIFTIVRKNANAILPFISDVISLEELYYCLCACTQDEFEDDKELRTK